MSLKPGWFERQCEQVRRDVAEWPAWMRREAGLEETVSTTPTIWTLELPGFVPASLNKIMRGHWSNGYRLKKHDADVILRAVRAYGVPNATGRRRVSLLIVLPPRQRAFDGDNVLKSTLDALTHAGALRNDSPAWVVWTPPVYARGPALTTFITLQEDG